MEYQPGSGSAEDEAKDQHDEQEKDLVRIQQGHRIRPTFLAYLGERFLGWAIGVAVIVVLFWGAVFLFRLFS